MTGTFICCQRYIYIYIYIYIALNVIRRVRIRVELNWSASVLLWVERRSIDSLRHDMTGFGYKGSNIIYLLTAIGLSLGGSGYFTCI